MSGWVAGSVVVGAVVGAVGSNMAASKQAAAQDRAAATQRGMFDTITGQEQPFMNAGYGAETSLSNLTNGSKGGIDPSTGLPNGYLTQTFNPTQDQLNKYPGYQFALQQGGAATRNADTPGSGALSGAALKDLTNFNVGTANQYYGQYFNQFQQQQNNIFDRLNGIATLGQNAASNTGAAGTTLGTGIAQAQAGAGASRGAGIASGANSIGNGIQLAGFLNGGNGGSNYSNPQNLGGSQQVAPQGSTLTYDNWGNITGSTPVTEPSVP